MSCPAAVRSLESAAWPIDQGVHVHAALQLSGPLMTPKHTMERLYRVGNHSQAGGAGWVQPTATHHLHTGLHNMGGLHGHSCSGPALAWIQCALVAQQGIVLTAHAVQTSIMPQSCMACHQTHLTSHTGRYHFRRSCHCMVPLQRMVSYRAFD